jgi:hypothetical protein
MKDDPYDPKNLELPPGHGLGTGKRGGAAAKTSKRLRPLAEPYIQLTETGARGFAIVGGRQAPVWFEILYRVWRAKTYTIDLPNTALAERGGVKAGQAPRRRPPGASRLGPG